MVATRLPQTPGGYVSARIIIATSAMNAQEPRRPSHSRSMSGTSQDTGLMCMKTEEYSQPRCSHYTPVGEVVSPPLAGHPRANCQTLEPTARPQRQRIYPASSLALRPGPSPRRRLVGPWLAPSDHWTVARRYLEGGKRSTRPLTPCATGVEHVGRIYT